MTSAVDTTSRLGLAVAGVAVDQGLPVAAWGLVAAMPAMAIPVPRARGPIARANAVDASRRGIPARGQREGRYHEGKRRPLLPDHLPPSPSCREVGREECVAARPPRGCGAQRCGPTHRYCVVQLSTCLLIRTCLNRGVAGRRPR